MSMPAFPEPSAILNHDEAVNAVLTSIALEETALSHILNAEGEKIQYALEHAKKLESKNCSKNGSKNGLETGPDIRMILDVNDSVTAMLEQITDLQFILLNKLNKALKKAPSHPGKACPVGTGTDRIPGVKPCGKLCDGRACARRQGSLKLGASRGARVSEFEAPPGYRWGSGFSLYLNAGGRRDTAVKLCSRNGESTVLLPSKGRFKIDADLKAHNGSSVTADIEISLAAVDTAKPRILASRRYSFGPDTQRVSLTDTLDWETPRDCAGAALTVKLLSPKYLNVRGGGIKVRRLD